MKLIPCKRKYQIKIGIKITLNLANILERNRRLRTQELSVSEHQNFKIFSDSMLPDPPAGSLLGTHVIRRLSKYILIVRTQKVEQSDY